MSDDKDTTPNRKGRDLIQQHDRAVAYRKRLERQLIEARNDEARAVDALAKWLAPADAKPGETFGIWERDADNREVLYRVTFTLGAPIIEQKRYR